MATTEKSEQTGGAAAESTGRNRNNIQSNEFDSTLTKGDVFTSRDVAAFEVPTFKDEAWRFTPLKRLRGLHDGSNAAATGTVSISVGDHDGATIDAISVETAPMDDARLGAAGEPSDRVQAQAFTSAENATIITVGKEQEIAEPVVVRMSGPGADAVAFAHTQIRVERFGRAVVVLDQTGSGTIAENVEFVVDDGGYLEVISVQDWEDDAVHLAGHHVRVGRDAGIKYAAATFGGELVRVASDGHFSGPGGDIEMLGLYFADDGQHFEHRLLVDHDVPNCRSNIMYKGALQGDRATKKPDAHAVWVGDVLIRAAATGTDTYELNRNLILTDGARADSIPNLEIETGEIEGAGHASATGRFDDEQLFYFQARGIPEEVARRLVVRGFFGEVIAKISVKEVRERLAEYVEDELALIGV
ncbi:Fe-S cluster assembly protein SufD [Dietzia sp.]|uniref:Fe-S cluster assembly protein SufD n=1 Tax=Dietzia sp. TaxID=1871616 RepID=UPI002FDB42A0